MIGYTNKQTNIPKITTLYIQKKTLYIGLVSIKGLPIKGETQGTIYNFLNIFFTAD